MNKKRGILIIFISLCMILFISSTSFQLGEISEKKKLEIDYTKQVKELHGEISNLELTISDQGDAIHDLKDMLKYKNNN